MRKRYDLSLERKVAFGRASNCEEQKVVLEDAADSEEQEVGAGGLAGVARSCSGRLFHSRGAAWRKERFVHMSDEMHGGRSRVRQSDDRVLPGG